MQAWYLDSSYTILVLPGMYSSDTYGRLWRQAAELQGAVRECLIGPAHGSRTKTGKVPSCPDSKARERASHASSLFLQCKQEYNVGCFWDRQVWGVVAPSQMLSNERMEYAQTVWLYELWLPPGPSQTSWAERRCCLSALGRAEVRPSSPRRSILCIKTSLCQSNARPLCSSISRLTARGCSRCSSRSLAISLIFKCQVKDYSQSCK